MRFALPQGVDPLAVRLALVSCRAPLRLERRARRVSIVASLDDALRARPRWLRVGVEPARAEEWPEARPIGSGVLVAEGRAWCLARAPLARAVPQADQVLLLTPIERDEALRTIANALRSRLRLRFAYAPGPLARVASAIVAGRDGVVLARAYLLASGATSGDALRALRSAGSGMQPLRASAIGAWREIGAQTGGVWRALSALEAWWC